MDKIKYTCKNCGWSCEIRQEWGDLKPKRCMNKKCNTSFLANKDSLIVTVPEVKVDDIILLNEKKDGKASNKRK